MAEFLILTICFNIMSSPDYFRYYPVCTTALTAAGIQSNVKQFIDKKQQKFENNMKDLTGELAWTVVGYTYGLSKQELKLGFNAKIINAHITLEYKNNEPTCNIIWEWK